MFADRIAPFNELIGKIYEKSGLRYTRTLQNIGLSTVSWGMEHDHALQYLQGTLRECVRMAHSQKEKGNCVFTDTSRKNL